MITSDLTEFVMVYYKDLSLFRFYYQGMWRQKITTSVDFPLEGLDMNRYISGPHQRPAYSLYAVSVCIASIISTDWGNLYNLTNMTMLEGERN